MEEKIKISRRKKILQIILGVFLVVILFCGIFYYFIFIPREQEKEAERARESKEAWIQSTLHNNPEAIQNFFADDIQNGTNDQHTKADAYWIVHRYSDTRGNVYEIYDYIQSRPHLAFIQAEADLIYPDVFEGIRNRTVEVGTDYTRYAYLAYIEVLKNHGYIDIAGLGTASNQYAKTAYFNTVILSEMAQDDKTALAVSKYISRDIEKSIQFADYAKDDVVRIMNGELTDKDLPARDILVGLNQYAAALRYRQSVGADYSSPKTADEVFDFATEYARNNVPQLVYFTGILNASTLVILNPEDPQKIKEALYPFLNFTKKKDEISDGSILHYIIDARFQDRKAIDIYSKRNVARLASRVHAFRLWLIGYGWTEEDFR
ncbi:MAG: hypothetical protein KBC83_02330 [Candidatus Moranbacteria bacterium]|nr:hypothetical protein [Candidatus Moranbacteria bacterium]MBP9801484.1 hypothetical protein [Candidatus Moranbacteria bacterium]